MGQQQLHLVILVMLIFCLATVVSINTMGENTLSANLDSVRQDMAEIALSAQGYDRKPVMLGGGGQSVKPDHSMLGRVTVDRIELALPGQQLP